MESTQLDFDRRHLDAVRDANAPALPDKLITVDPAAPRGAFEARGPAVHVLTWRLLDYDGEDLTYGGQQRWLLELSHALNAQGRPVVVHQRAHAPFERRLREGLTVRGHACSTRALGSPQFNVLAHRAIERDAAVVYMVEDLAFPHCRRHSIVVQHGIWWDGEYSWLKVRLAERIVRHVVRRAGAVVCVDTNFINWYRARWPDSGHDHKLHYLPNFIDPGQWGPQPIEPAARCRAGDPVTICFPRRSEPRRGIWLMAAVAPKLAERYPNTQFRFVVGSGYRTQQLRQRLVGSGLAADRWTLESLPFQRMREAYADSAIAVVPTTCGEGTSLSAIEAMYFGCAVVATWVGGLPNLIQHEHNGLLIAPHETALENALARLIEDAELRVRLGHTAMTATPRLYGLERWQRGLQPLLTHTLQQC